MKEQKKGSSTEKAGRQLIAIQGYEGSFHQTAAREFFGSEVEVVPCGTFRQVVKLAADKKQCDGGIMAIENSIAGSILPNYHLLQKSNLVIAGEIFLRIRQHLMVNKGVQLGDIREVHSHPMAILQCTDYLDKQNWKLVETEDTALSAKYIRRHNSKHIAAIAGRLAAELYGLDIIAPNIHTEKNNYTRFLVLRAAKNAAPVEDANKASLNFKTDHSRGSLAKVLSVIADGGINLSKLQSFPIPGSNFLYSFYADMEFDNENQFNKVINGMLPLTRELNIQGIYKKAKIND
jgi:prephenate dehydratase